MNSMNAFPEQAQYLMKEINCLLKEINKKEQRISTSIIIGEEEMEQLEKQLEDRRNQLRSLRNKIEKNCQVEEDEEEDVGLQDIPSSEEEPSEDQSQTSQEPVGQKKKKYKKPLGK